MSDIDTLETDVLIIGGGLAGLRAAAELQSEDCEVVVATKGIAARAGSSAITSAGFTVAIGHADPTDSPGLHFEDTINGGAEINDRVLVRIFCHEAVDRFWELTQWGVAFERDGSGDKYLQYPSGDHSKPRVTVCATHKGIGITIPLKKRASRVTYQNRLMVVDLMRDNHGVSGALALDTRSHDLICILAKVTILATGGVGQLYPVTSNPNDVTGDSLALAFRAGAKLSDVEFVQFYPWRLINHVRSRMPIQPSSFATGATLRNSRGERFMLNMDPGRGEATTRDLAARGIYNEIVEGRDIEGGVLLDLSQIPIDTFSRLNPRVASYFEKRGLELGKSRLLLAPEAHYHMGGVRIDQWGRASLTGLYAVGEASAGVDGGNRLDSNAIPAGQVYGRRAGMDAAIAVKERRAPRVDEELLNIWSNKIRFLQSPKPREEDVQVLKDLVREIMHKHAGIIRSGRSLHEGIQRIEQLRERISRGRPADPNQLPEYLEAENMALAARLILTAAAFREESRGAHFRTDKPERDDSNWKTSLEIHLGEEDKIEVGRHSSESESESAA